MPSVGFEPTISEGDWPQTYALDRAATGTDSILNINKGYSSGSVLFSTRGVLDVSSLAKIV